jgi:hypothetical protein
MSGTRRFLRTTESWLWMAAAAALVASICDLMMLAVALVPPTDLWAAPNLLLGVSAMFGTTAIAFYAVGYAAIGRSLGAGHSGLRRTISLSGLIVGFVGGVIHATTAWLIYQAQFAGDAWAVNDALRVGPLLPILWGAAGTASVVAASVITFSAFSGRSSLSRIVAAQNPVAATIFIVVAVLALGSDRLSEVLVPAAPNLAHVLFFVAAASSAARTRRAEGLDQDRAAI